MSNVRTIRLQFTGGKPNVDPQTVAALWAYGVQVLCDGDKDWENEELETLLEGVEETANALHQSPHGLAQGRTAE